MAAKMASTEPRPSARFVLTADAPLALVGEPDGELPLEVFVDEPVEFVPFSAIASWRNAVELRGESSTGLTEKTMPAPQCDVPSGLCCLHC